jgi:hypothetical protein
MWAMKTFTGFLYLIRVFRVFRGSPTTPLRIVDPAFRYLRPLAMSFRQACDSLKSRRDLRAGEE